MEKGDSPSISRPRRSSGFPSRPFGVALLIGGHDENGPSLYYTDPSGLFCQCNAKAIGSGCDGADKYLQQHYNEDLTLTEAKSIVLSAMRETTLKR